MGEIFDLHADALRAIGRAENTIKGRLGTLRRADLALPLGVDYAYDEEIIAYLANPRWSAKTRACYDYHLREYYVWAHRAGYLESNPMEELPNPRWPECLPRPATNEQVATILAEAVNPVRMCSILAAWAGLRCCEIARLRRDDVDQRQTWIRCAKGGNPAVIDTAPIVWDAVVNLGSGLLVEQAGGRADPAWISRAASDCYHKLGMPISIHQLRHWFGTAMRRAGHDILTIKGALRHKHLSSTEGYVKVVDEERRRAILGLPTLGWVPS